MGVMDHLQTTLKRDDIPHEVTRVTDTLEDAGFEAYLVGGCVRDILRGVTPKDWDITTSATPEEITNLFDHAHYDNDFGTVRVVNDSTEDERLKVVEVTTFRTEAAYTDDRRPDSVEFSNSIQDDLKRRDFTINALALRVPTGANVAREPSDDVSYETFHVKTQLVDLFDGIQDLKDGVIRTVGDPHERFSEDALRMLRAVRFAAELGFTINNDTKKAIAEESGRLERIAIERIRDEFTRIINSANPKHGLELSHTLDILQFIVPELEKTRGVEQNQAHSYDVWEHLTRAVQATAEKDWPLHIRLAALFHDISKPETRRFSEEKQDFTFYGHEVVGSRVTKRILQRLKYPKKLTKTVVTLVRWHMFFSDPDEISMSAVRRLIRNVGKEHIWDLIKLRIADRIGTGRPKERPYRLRKYESMIEEALRDPISTKMLAIDGNDIMETTNIAPGPTVGYILHALLEEVLDDPEKNNRAHLKKRAVELSKLPEEELKERGKSGEQRRREAEEKAIQEIREKYWVE